MRIELVGSRRSLVARCPKHRSDPSGTGTEEEQNVAFGLLALLLSICEGPTSNLG
jgi:hypothetical protein